MRIIPVRWSVVALSLLLGSSFVYAQTITVVAGTYGGNCQQPRGNKKPHLAQSCNGQGRCEYTINYQVIGDPAVGCAKNYVAEWQCGGRGPIHRAEASPEAGFNKTVLLSCP
jgi:hypothetical protein